MSLKSDAPRSHSVPNSLRPVTFIHSFSCLFIQAHIFIGYYCYKVMREPDLASAGSALGGALTCGQAVVMQQRGGAGFLKGRAELLNGDEWEGEGQVSLLRRPGRW